MSGPAEPNRQFGEVKAMGRQHIRSFVRSLVLIGAVMLLLSAAQTHWPIVVPALSPFVAVGSFVATRAFTGTAWLGLMVGAIVLLYPRWFCRWVCPMGHCAKGVSQLGQRCGRRPLTRFSLGRWIVLVTLAGACLGYPLLLWLDSLAIFSGALGIVRSPAAPASWAAAVPLLLVLLLSFLWPYIWCSRICPLGATQDMLAWLSRRIRRDKDKTGENPKPQRWNLPLARRTVLGAAIGAACASAARLAHGSAQRPLRPPGAIDEPQFLGVCVRCGNCLRACPTHIIEPSLGKGGVAGLLTPILSFKANYCLVECTKCMHVCPSGALVRLSPEDKVRNPIGLPQVDMNVCLLGQSRECSECRRWCPHGAIRYAWSEIEYTLVPQIDPEKCSGCGACEVVCPTKPKKAIVVVPLGDPTNA